MNPVCLKAETDVIRSQRFPDTSVQNTSHRSGNYQLFCLSLSDKITIFLVNIHPNDQSKLAQICVTYFKMWHFVYL